ncbi:hypothetical protein ACRASO_004323 [Yersinia enterocolitica]
MMNNIEERIESLKANIALSELIGPDELTVTVSDLSALIAQLEAARKELSDLKFADYKLWHGAACNNHQKVLRLEAELLAANEKLSKPVVLPQRYECEGYHIGEAYLDPNPEGDCFDRDEVIEAIKAAGFTVEGNADA